MNNSSLPQVVVGNLLADAFIVGLLVLTLSTYSKFYRDRLLRFFRAAKGTRDIQCYVSRLYIERGMLRHEPDIWNGYSGAAINRNEYRGASKIAELFRPWGLAIIPPAFRGPLADRVSSRSGVRMRIDTAPKSAGEVVKSSAYLLLGTGAHSVASKLALERRESFFEFTRDDDGNRTFRLKHECGMWISFGRSRNPETNVEQGIVQRLTMPFPNEEDPEACVVMCAGLGSNATMNSAYFLAANWQAMLRRYGEDDFGLVLRFPLPTADSEDLLQPAEVLAVRRHNRKVQKADPV